MTHHIKNSLSHIIKKETDWRHELLANWSTIMGDLSDKVRLEKVQGSTLVLGVYDPSWMQELFMLSSMLIANINKQLPKPYVTDLRFKAAAKKKEKPKPERRPTPTPKPVTLKAHEREALEKIKDTQLRSVLHQFLVRCYQQR